VIGLPDPAANGPETLADAPMVIEPGAAPVTVIVAMPPDAVLEPRPVTVPVPPVVAKVTLAVLPAPVVIVLPAASWIVAVNTRVLPAVRSVVAPLSAT